MNEIILSSPSRVLFTVGSFEIYIYSLLIAISILLGVIISNHLANKSNKLPQNFFIEISPIVILSGILGARGWYCLLNYSEFSNNILNIFNLRGGGISIHGALLGGLIALIFLAKTKDIKLSTLCDYSVIGVSLGQAIGRIGNFFNNEAFGLPYDGVCKLFIPYTYRPEGYKEFSYFHPTFLYESVADFLLFLFLLYILQKNPKPTTTTLTYLLCYSIIRFFIELIRIDCNVHVLGLPFPAIVSVIIFFIALILLVIRLKSR